MKRTDSSHLLLSPSPPGQLRTGQLFSKDLIRLFIKNQSEIGDEIKKVGRLRGSYQLLVKGLESTELRMKQICVGNFQLYKSQLWIELRFFIAHFRILFFILTAKITWTILLLVCLQLTKSFSTKNYIHVPFICFCVNNNMSNGYSFCFYICKGQTPLNTIHI